MNDPATIKCFCCDLNWSRFDLPDPTVYPSAPDDWAFIDPQAYFDWHVEFGNNVTFCQAYAPGIPAELRPHPSYESDLRIVSNAFHEIG